MSVSGDNIKFPHTPNNPSGGTTIQVGCTGKRDEHVVIPPGTVVFNTDSKAIGRGVNRVPVGQHTSTADSKVIGVSMDGIVDPESAKMYHESAGRYSVAVSGSVTLFAAIRDGSGNYKMPSVLDTLYVKVGGTTHTVTTSTGHNYEFPEFKTRRDDVNDKKIGVVHWVNDNFKNDQIAEVRVHLDLF
jgi:hypothetical protein